MMNARLHSMVKNVRKYYLYVIHYKLLNGANKYVQMRYKNIFKNSIYLSCSNSKCKAKLSLNRHNLFQGQKIYSYIGNFFRIHIRDWVTSNPPGVEFDRRKEA